MRVRAAGLQAQARTPVQAERERPGGREEHERRGVRAAKRAAWISSLPWGAPSPAASFSPPRPCAGACARERIHHATGFDPWYLEQLERILAAEARLRRLGPPADAALWREIKHLGFTDARIAALTGTSEPELRAARRALDLAPSLPPHRHLGGRVPFQDPLPLLGLGRSPPARGR